jgi:diadenosine tetraphosphate (Ap4A) HIT family hydrolase
MAHSSFDASCAVCQKLYGAAAVEPVFANGLWQVLPIDGPPALPGWMLLISRRHVAGPAQFDPVEAQSFGPTLCHLERVLLDVTSALRIYTAALGESSPHFHCHMVPRYATMPKDAKAWGVFDLQRAAAAGEIQVDAAEAQRVQAAYRAALAKSPPEGPPRA